MAAARNISCRGHLLPYLPHLVKDLRLRVLLHKPGDLIHQAVRHRVVGHDCGHPDHRDLVDILLVDLRRRDMKPVLQLRDNTFDDHSLFFEAVHPRCVKPECHYSNIHTFLQRVCWAALASPVLVFTSGVSLKMNPASTSRHFSNISGGWLRAYILHSFQYFDHAIINHIYYILHPLFEFT